MHSASIHVKIHAKDQRESNSTAPIPGGLEPGAPAEGGGPNRAAKGLTAAPGAPPAPEPLGPENACIRAARSNAGGALAAGAVPDEAGAGCVDVDAAEDDTGSVPDTVAGPDGEALLVEAGAVAVAAGGTAAKAKGFAPAPPI